MFVKGLFTRYWRYLLTFICGCAVITTGPSCVTGGRNGGGGGGGGTSPLLIITSISASNITGVAATITWRTNRPADSMVEYGVTTSYGNVVTLKTLETDHQMTLFGLSSDTLYHFRVKSKDEANNPSTSGDLTFTTVKGSPTPTPTPVPTPTPGPGLPAITSFTATPSSITSGQSSTLSWSVTGATSLRLNPGNITVTGQTSRSVSPTLTTAYTLTATNNAGSVTRSVTVNVTNAPPPPPLPVIASFSASPGTITSGQSSTLSWSVTGATELRLDPGNTTVTGQTSRSVSPTSTTTYTLTATNNAGSLARSVLVTVNVPPPPGVFLLAPYTGPFTEVEARALFDRFGFGAPPERIAQAVSDGLDTTISKLTTWQSEGNLDGIVNDWVCDGWLSGEGLNTCSSNGTYDFHNKMYANSKLIKFLHSPNQYFYKLILFLHDERLAGSGLNEDPWFMRHAYVDHWNMLLRAAQGGDYKQFMRDWMKDGMGHVFWQDGALNLKSYPNENFAREFWELGTVGTTTLDGAPTYSDFDIAAAARVHTGYSRQQGSDANGPYWYGAYRDADHASGAFDIFVGTPYYAKVSTQEELLQATFRHPRTAESLAEDLWKEFINPYKDPNAIRELAGIIRHYNYNLTPVMQTIMRSKALYADGSKETLIKQPIELVIGLLRSFPSYSPANIHSGDDYTVLAWHTGALDQTFFSPNSIFGWDENVLAGASYIKTWRDVSNQLLTKTVGSNGEHLAKYSVREHFWTRPGFSTTDQLIDRLTSCFNVPLNSTQRGHLRTYLDTQPRLGAAAQPSPFPNAGANQQEERIKGAIAILINQPSYRTK
jgi:uncharacterized protein DUF1800